MTNMWTNEKIIDFINEVYLHPELWDVKSGLYKDRNAKKDGWLVIAEKFEITSDEAYKKFRSLRTYAHNEEKKKKKSGSAGGKPVKWFAFDAISFVLTQNIANTGLDSENATPNVTETTDTDNCAGPEELVEAATTDTFEYIDTTPKPRARRSKTRDPLLEKAQNIIRDAGEKERNEYAGFGEHVAYKLSKYDEYTRSQTEFKIMQILYETDMRMHRTRARSTSTPNPHNNRSGGEGTSQSQYTDTSISTPPIQDDFQYFIVPDTEDVTSQTELEQNTLQVHRTQARSTSTPNPHNNRSGGAGTSQSQYTDTSISTPPIQDNFQYFIVPDTEDVTSQTELEQNSLPDVFVSRNNTVSGQTHSIINSYEQLVSIAVKNESKH